MKNWTKTSTPAYIRFSVKDTGAGIEEKDFGMIFSAFEQVRLINLY
jgi:signal transduction histidine kinase